MIEEKISNWKTLVNIIESSFLEYPASFADHIQFRGQSDFTWNLTPSITRIITGNKKAEEKSLGYETQTKIDFISQAHLFDPNLKFDNTVNDSSAFLVDMQHYSCPTRLLDWTSSPYVGLYFAVNDNFNTDGSLFILNFAYYQINLERAYKTKSELNGNEILEFKDFDRLELIFSTKKNERIVRQQGAFTISNNILKNHDEIINETATKAGNQKGLMKIIIPSELKFDFLCRLKFMNISSQSLFPDLDGLGKSIRESLLIRKWGQK